MCSRLGAYLSALAMLLIVFLITVEIVLRTFLNSSTLFADEYSGYLMVSLVMLGLSYTLSQGSHIRITIFIDRLSGRPRQILDIIVTLAVISLCSYALYHAVTMVLDTHEYQMLADSISETPLYLPQTMIPVGLLLLDLQLLAHLLRRLLSSATP